MVVVAPLETIEDGLRRLHELCVTHPQKANIGRMEEELAVLRQATKTCSNCGCLESRHDHLGCTNCNEGAAACRRQGVPRLG